VTVGREKGLVLPHVQGVHARRNEPEALLSGARVRAHVEQVARHYSLRHPGPFSVLRDTKALFGCHEQERMCVLQWHGRSKLAKSIDELHSSKNCGLIFFVQFDCRQAVPPYRFAIRQ
jgi:hypothetical protein